MPSLKVSLDPEDIEAFKTELSGVEQLAMREQLTDAEAEDWAAQAANDLANSVKVEQKL
jgi:hypothetical protein